MLITSCEERGSLKSHTFSLFRIWQNEWHATKTSNTSWAERINESDVERKKRTSAKKWVGWKVFEKSHWWWHTENFLTSTPIEWKSCLTTKAFASGSATYSSYVLCAYGRNVTGQQLPSRAPGPGVVGEQLGRDPKLSFALARLISTMRSSQAGFATCRLFNQTFSLLSP